MCGGGSAPKDNSAQIAADQQAKKEANVKLGEQAIYKIFGGGTMGTNPATAYDPNGKYYDADGNPVSVAAPKAATPATGVTYTINGQTYNSLPRGYVLNRAGQIVNSSTNNPSGTVNAAKPAQAAGAAPDVSQYFTSTGANPGQFDDAYYNNIEKSYDDYYNPQLDTQYGDALNHLTLQLGQQGILNSSEGNRQLALLDQNNKTQRDTVANNGKSQAQSARQAVAQEKQQLLQQNQTAADPSLAAQSAAAGAQSVQSTPSYSPLGSVFAGLLGTGTNALSIQQGGLANAGSAGTVINPFSSVAGIGSGGNANASLNGTTVK